VPSEFHQAIVLRTWDWSETSQTAILLTESAGLVRVLAKGSRRPQSVFSGGLEPLTLGQAGLHVKQGSIAATELSLLTEWDLQQVYPTLRSNLTNYHIGLLLVEVTTDIIQNGDPHPLIFAGVKTALESLQAQRHPMLILTRFLWTTLQAAGFEPVIDRDVKTNAPLLGATAFFVPELGGTVLPTTSIAGLQILASKPLAKPLSKSQTRSAQSSSINQGPAAWPVRIATLRALSKVIAPTSADQPQDRRVGSLDIGRAARLLASFFSHISGRDLRTLQLALDHAATNPTQVSGPRTDS
jgi:DNA repair protein RecO